MTVIINLVGCFIMVKVTTSIKIDNEKRELAKKRGIILTDLLDQALDMALGIEFKESTQLQRQKEELIQSKELLEKEKEEFLKDYEARLMEIDFKIKAIDNSLENAIIEDKEETKTREYNLLLRKGLKIGGIEDKELLLAINDYADKYEMSEDEYQELLEKLNQDIIDNLM